MQRLLITVLALALVLLPASTFATDFEDGDRVVLRATNPLGVPLHREPRSSMFGRSAEGAEGEVRDTARGGRWLKVQIDEGPLAWIVEKYLAAAGEREPARASIAARPIGDDDMASVFASREACEEAVWAGEHFGDPRRPGKETDLAWLSCALAYLRPDIVALQEILATREADVAWAAVIDGLEAFLGGDWRVDLQACGGEEMQHVGFLYNAKRVTLEAPFDAWQMNGAAEGDGDPCAGNLRPGRAAYVRSVAGGADFHIVAVHGDSGTQARDFDHRQAAIERLDGLLERLRRRDDDGDLIVLGDFNTMGASERMGAAEEIEALKRTIADEGPGFRLLEPRLGCTEYYMGECGHLDHVLVTATMEEARDARTSISGYCAELGGVPLGAREPAAYDRLSDHCPLVVDVKAEDRD